MPGFARPAIRPPSRLPTIAAAEKVATNGQSRRGPGSSSGRVVRLIEEGRDGNDVVTQLAAVHRALDRAGFAIVSSGMREGFTSPDGIRAKDEATIQELFPTHLKVSRPRWPGSAPTPDAGWRYSTCRRNP